MPIVALVRDLLFSSRISATARAQGAEIVLLCDPALLAAQNATRLIADLNQPGALEAAIEYKKSHGEKVHITGFASHVDVETIERARTGGIDRVLARSQFVEELPSLLQP